MGLSLLNTVKGESIFIFVKCFYPEVQRKDVMESDEGCELKRLGDIDSKAL